MKPASTHEASASATGYLFQCRYALLAGLQAIAKSPQLEISIEKFDDVGFEVNGEPTQLIQTKHHVGKLGNLTDASVDLWKTLLIWTKRVTEDVEAPFRIKFVLLTTGFAPDGSAAALLRMRENEILRVQQDSFILQARTTGKITQYVETASTADTSSGLKSAIAASRIRVAALERELDAEAMKEKLDAFLNIIGRYMTQYSDDLELEHRGSQLRLDIRALTVVADTLDGPVPLFRMGSGENWVGYHVLAHLALHKWFRQKKRPVPGFIIFDQPSQAHYPPDRDAEGSIDGLSDEDQTAVLQLFKLAADAAAELAPELQIIIMDHADLKPEWFATAVIERWRKGEKLIPASWLQ
ncbi:DUF3732 domain-containing protein [Blastomonas sp. UPD001]|uniref:DUF3732 domain-containing protein n=1 Tax=Blastomonas sp. UPD001 TaxID=2217673 RepID=UPI000E34E410|nr:DUF3732 domain-containing protein [Blastomonas sp. UPD001]